MRSSIRRKGESTYFNAGEKLFEFIFGKIKGQIAHEGCVWGLSWYRDIFARTGLTICCSRRVRWIHSSLRTDPYVANSKNLPFSQTDLQGSLRRFVLPHIKFNWHDGRELFTHEHWEANLPFHLPMTLTLSRKVSQ